MINISLADKSEEDMSIGLKSGTVILEPHQNEWDIEGKGYQNDYGYWDRNGSMNKHVFLCGGSQEDPDYADKYNGNPTTLEGLEALKNDLTSHGADVTYKLYESHHYQYIPEMLVEYLKTAYPAK